MNKTFKEVYGADSQRFAGGGHALAFVKYLRLAQYTENKIFKLYSRWRLMRLHEKYGLEISWRVKIGKGFYIGHAYGITINDNAILGENINIHKGVTIGQENRGDRQGAPVIGNKVWIGVNATIVGKITIGNDVLIAPNSYVNCDVPDHSVVFGNPCIIKHKDNATEGYINNVV